MKKILFFFSVIVLCVSCADDPQAGFVTQNKGHFEVNNKPYYFVGTNFWYGAILGSTGQGGNRERLLQELDFLQANGINNLRILVGADGYSGQAVKVMPTLQLEPGVYNDTIFDGLDYLLSEMAKRKMYAVLYINNSWEWSGGYGQYLSWAGYGEVPPEGVRDWQKFLNHVSQYAACDSCKTLFFDHLQNVITRTNRYTQQRYVDDPTIMSWQVGNEPRVFSDEGKPAFAEWLQEATALIRSLDANHLISIGNEGTMGSEGDMQLYEDIHADTNVNYLTIHIWPKNWGWVDSAHVVEGVDTAIKLTDFYINAHSEIAAKLQKPLVIEEFGYPRNHHLYVLEDSTTARDKFYANIFEHVLASSRYNGMVAGCNFWSWAGFGRAAHKYWQPWDDYLGDPSQEEQGLNSVFNTDPTVKVAKKYALRINEGNGDIVAVQLIDL
ncbi:endo-1,4-beta-mannosidase [Bacteroidia bacterium]|nr:endo-1,4-beta-mannosidase [Bacteroidia bacterium]